MTDADCGRVRTARETLMVKADKGTTVNGYVNRNGQVTIRNTQQAGSDHLRYVYHLACSKCGYNYGSNGSDIFDRKCPECQGGRHGLPYDHS